jgi:hypothetical protein
MDLIGAGGKQGSNLLPVLIFVGVGVLLIGGVIWARISQRRRREALEAWGDARGLAFHPSNDYTIERHYPAFECLQRGRNRYARNILWGPCGAYWFVGFDYCYTTGSGKNQCTHNFSAVILDAGMELKPLLVRPEGLLDKVAAVFGYGDIAFENAEFSSRFHVTAPDEQWAHEALPTETMEYLLSMPKFTIQMAGPLIAVHKDRAFRPKDFEDATAVACTVAGQLPEGVVRRLGPALRREESGNLYGRPEGA